MVPDLLTTLQGTVMDVISQIPPEGLQFDERLQAVSTLAARLTDPTRVEKLHALLDVVEAAPDIMEAIMGAIQDVRRKGPPISLRIDERLQALLPLVDKLTSPETTRRLTELLELSEMAPDMVNTVMGMSEDLMKRMPSGGLQLDERIAGILPRTDKLTQPKTTQTLKQLLALIDFAAEQFETARAAGTDFGAVQKQIGAMTQAFLQASSEREKRVGIMGLMGALSDKDRQLAIGFLMNFLKTLGQKIA